MKKRRRAIKTRNIQTIQDRKTKELYREVQRQVREVNQRLNSLERRHARGTWSSGKLMTRIQSNKTKGLLYKGKRIKLKPKMTKTNLVQVQKATKQFLESSTSTNKGIKKVRESTIKSIKDTLNLGRDKTQRISDKDAEFLYSTLEDRKIRDLIDEIGASTVWWEVDLARQQHTSEYEFVERLNMYIEQGMDDDLREQAIHIYNTYVI